MKKDNITDIEEIIADAKAEEEVAREQAKAAKEEKARADFRDELRKQIHTTLDDFIKEKKASNKVTIDLDEYITLKQKEIDLDRILSAIVDSVYLNYSKDDLRLDGDRPIEVMRVLYPEAYDALLAAELAKVNGE